MYIKYYIKALTIIFLISFLGYNITPSFAQTQASANNAVTAGTYYLPYKKGQKYLVTRAGKDHSNQIDFKMPKGTPVIAARAGYITEIIESNTKSGCYSSYAKYNNQVVIEDRTTGEKTYYIHLNTNSVPDYLKVGSYVHRGTLIGKSGNIGYVCGANGGYHLHFAVYKSGSWLVPKFADVTGGVVYTGKEYISGNVIYFTPTPTPTKTAPPTFTSTATYTSTSTPSLTLTSSMSSDTPTVTFEPTDTYTSTAMPSLTATLAIPQEPIVVQPSLKPAYPDACQSSHKWLQIPGGFGWDAFLTLNINGSTPTHTARWWPEIPLTGTYKVEIYVPYHSSVTLCGKSYINQTSVAKYQIWYRGPNGTTVNTTKTIDQSVLSGDWKTLATLDFTALDSSQYIKLTNITTESALTKLISFGAIRFTYIAP